MSDLRKSCVTIIALGLVFGLCATSRADLLNVNLSAPIIDSDANGHMSYDPAMGQLNVDGTPLAITFADGNFAFVDAPRSLSVRLLVDVTGGASSNGTTDDLIVQGSVDVDGDGVADYSGILLTGQIKKFGYTYSGTQTNSFDYVFRVTGGSMASLFADGDIGFVQTSENSTFTGSFATAFSGKSKGHIGLVPIFKVTTHSLSGHVACTSSGAPMPGVTITVLDAASNVAGTALTGIDGAYTIDDLPAATYTISATLAAHMKFCGDSTVAVSMTDTDATADFCICPLTPSSINGKVTCSRDGSSIAGVTIAAIDSSNAVVGSATTQADGSYTISGLYAGSYTVRMTPITNTTLCGSDSMPVILVSETDGTADFCLCPCEGSTIVGMVKSDSGAPQAGITVTVYDSANAVVAAASTGADGLYAIPGLPPGAYTVTVIVPPKYQACSDTSKGVTLLCEQDGQADFCISPPPPPACETKIGGTVKSSSGCQSKPVAGATIQVVNKSNNQVVATQTTAADGTYSILNLPAGNYLVKVIAPQGYKIGCTSSVCLTLACGQTKTVDFCLYPDCTPATVTGTVKAGCKTVSGAIIKAYDSNNVEKGSATTGCYGTYTIANLPAGTYTIKITPPSGYKVSGSASVSVTLSSGQTATVDFCLVADCAPAKVTGTIKTSCKPVAGVVVKAYDASNAVKGSDVTGCDGTYAIASLPAGNYTIKITVPDGYKPCGSTSASVTLSSGQCKIVDFWLSVDCTPAAVTGTVKASCKGVSGVTVKAFDCKNVEKGSAVTGCDGKYTITNLPAGKYTIKIIVPKGYKACGSTSASIALSNGQTKGVDFSICKTTSSGCGDRDYSGGCDSRDTYTWSCGH